MRVDPAAVVAGVFGAGFFAWLAGTRVLMPTEISWVMQGDWQWHFLGWHFFRAAPWTTPPGAISTYLAPVGSAVGLTDSIPLVAIPLKSVHAWLPQQFQYLGLWLVLCFALQGVFGALVIGTWTERRELRALGGMLLVLVPTLLARFVHPALCAHWLLLWALWLVWRSEATRRDTRVQCAALGLIAGLIHPYLAAMTLALLAAAAFRAPVALGAAIVGVVVGWWMSGVFTVGRVGEMLRIGPDHFSVNLLGPFDPAGRSSLLPDLPRFAQGQFTEGYHYFGVGLLAICLVALMLWVRGPRSRVRPALPLIAVAMACALFAMSPAITFGSRELIDLTSDRFNPAAMFRATGRFFWPLTYVVIASAIGVIATRLSARRAAVALSIALIVQIADLYPWYQRLHGGARGQQFHDWQPQLRSPEWAALLPRYRHMTLYFPESCQGPAPVDFVEAAVVAGTYGLSLNTGFAARSRQQEYRAYCERLREEFAAGVVNDETVYVIAPTLVAEFAQRTADRSVCRDIDGVHVCVSARSHARP